MGANNFGGVLRNEQKNNSWVFPPGLVIVCSYCICTTICLEVCGLVNGVCVCLLCTCVSGAYALSLPVSLSEPTPKPTSRSVCCARWTFTPVYFGMARVSTPGIVGRGSVDSCVCVCVSEWALKRSHAWCDKNSPRFTWFFSLHDKKGAFAYDLHTPLWLAHDCNQYTEQVKSNPLVARPSKHYSQSI